MNVLRFGRKRRLYAIAAALLFGVALAASAALYTSQSSAYDAGPENATLPGGISVGAIAPEIDDTLWARVWIPEGVYDPLLADGDLYRMDGNTLLVIPQESDSDVLRYDASPVRVGRSCEATIEASAGDYEPPYCD